MESLEGKCPGCSQLLLELDFKNHLRKCKKYAQIKNESVNAFDIPDNLNFGDINMKIAQIDLDYENIEEIVSNQLQNQNKSKSYICSKIRIIVSSMNKQNIKKDAAQSSQVKCNKCDWTFYPTLDYYSMFYVEGCWHVFCKACIMRYFDQYFVQDGGHLTCPKITCDKQIPQNQLKLLVGPKRYEAQQVKAIRKMMNLVECVACKIEFEYISGKTTDSPLKDETGKLMSLQNKTHYAENRFICPKSDCKTEQCKSCQSSPYHMGMTCQQNKQRSNMKLCRYCEEPINEKNASKSEQKALFDICNNQQCQALSKRACLKIHDCQHPCGGCRDEKVCLPCLRQPCCNKNQDLKEQKGDEYCNICFVESLNASPCVRSSCGHIFHQKCLQKRYKIKWLTPRIIFNFCLCPLCKQWIILAEDHFLNIQIQKNLKLYEQIEKMSYERLKFQECQKDERLTNPESPYYQKPVEYAVAIYAYFMCFKCQKPYFGGRKNCADAMNQQQNMGQFKQQELICANCCQIPVQNCPKHGKQFIEFKCQFCCSIAQWFCWGTTHFCQKCHKRQCNHDYVTKIPKDKLPKCKGPKACPIGGDHGGNGKQKSLGCAICRNYKQNKKNF